ncbi:MAG: diphosphomevalonate decarboxylase [Patescibacteria group bacterium]|nr:diphosphomevalonate decarboxylase [Patescibacteria group bacterium]
MKATAIANANIALIKYWGKRDEKLILPNNGSVSLTLDKLNTITTVEFDKKYDKDILILDDQELKEGEELEKAIKHLDLIREISGIKELAKVVSKNNFPTAAGLASSASGFTALSLAGTKAAGKDLDQKELSILARRSGSGSAARSCVGGFVEWLKGGKEDGTDSYAVQIAPPNHWPELRMLTTIVSTVKKKVSSTAGMDLTVKTSPMYKAWLAAAAEDLEKMRKGVLNKDFKSVGKTAESNCLNMHATMITTHPSLIYWMPTTLEIIHSVLSWRDQGLECYFTIDAGPQVKIICLEKDVPELEKKLKNIKGVKKIIICKPGGGPRLTDNHLF